METAEKMIAKDELGNQNMEIECYTGGFFQTNGYLLRCPDGNILIDAPEGVSAWLQEKDVQIDELLLTHLHYDHVIDAALLKREQAACRIRSHSAYHDDLTLATFLSQSIGWPSNLEAFEVDELLEGQSRLQVGGLEFALHHVPGHSPDSICFYLAGENDGGTGSSVLFGGDVLFNGGIGRTDFPNGGTELLIGGIREKVLTLPDDTIVFPGHGPDTTVAKEKQSNPFLV